MENLISASIFCSQHNIEVSFIYSLQDYGLIETTTTEKDVFVQADQLQELERLMRLHYDLHINLEGVDAVTQLLKRVEKMQEEMMYLKNRLRLYESSPRSTANGQQ
jgi:hypothetical protein